MSHRPSTGFIMLQLLAPAPNLLFPPSPSEAGLADRSHRFFETLTSDLHATAVAVAVVTSAINSLTDWRTTIVPADVASYAPHGATLRALLAVADANPELGALDVPALDAFLDELDGARHTLDQYLDDCEMIGAERAGSLHAHRLQMFWRPLCKSAKGVVAEIDRALPVSLPELYLQNSRVTAALLSGAATGLRPCLNADGKLYVPALPQKRRWPRRTVLQNGLVRCGETVQSAFVRDASAGGLGLDRVAGLRRGDAVAIEFASGRTLHGIIAWAAGTSAGVRFDVPLPATDPMIAL